ncbi:MAG: DUF1643 domain-containing protein [Magnetococcales bacterium]|nr:DUF1643 domain-containing protein [Magnetococcales bacterium]
MTNPIALKAADLKLRFGVYGHFYEMTLGGVLYHCRSVLELIAHERTPQEPNRIMTLAPDLLVIMMNPGSSRPLDRDYQPRRVRSPSQIGVEMELTPTRPDNTQYQVMRLMAAKGYQHARVLNLSDLREPKSPILIRTVSQLSQVRGGGAHTLFSVSRKKEREELLGAPGQTPVLVGWGRDKGLLPLVEPCLAALKGFTTVGVAVAGDDRLYAHPSPMLQRLKEGWLAAILSQLNQSSP